jgi:hypothetical protein
VKSLFGRAKRLFGGFVDGRLVGMAGFFIDGIAQSMASPSRATREPGGSFLDCCYGKNP